jgi:hypothetical protein
VAHQDIRGKGDIKINNRFNMIIRYWHMIIVNKDTHYN